MPLSLRFNSGGKLLFCGRANSFLLAAFLLSFILVGCNREDKLSPNSDNSISFSVSSSSAKKSLSKGVVSSTKNSLSSESSSNALASDEFYFGEIAYEQNGSSVSDDFGNFSITIEPNDGHFRESNSNVYEISSKTAYSGQYYTEGGKKYERIDWVAGDKLSLWSDKAKVLTYLSNNGYNWATYEVIGVNTENLKSKGMIMPENGGNGLWWDKNGGSHTFIGFYPAISGGVQSSSDLRYYTYELPTSQICKQSSTDDNLYEANLSQYGFMSAYKKSSPTNSLPIEFLPGFSAIEFHIKGASDVNMILKSVDIESASNYLSTKSGERNYRVGYNVDGSSRLLDFESAATKSEKKVSLTFKDKNGAAINPALDNSTPTKFTIILSGAEDITDLTITLNMDFEKGGTTTSGKRTLLLKDKTTGTPITIPACSKVVITNIEATDYFYVITKPDDIIYWGHEAYSENIIIDSYKELSSASSIGRSSVNTIEFKYYEDASNSITDPNTEIASAAWETTSPAWLNNGSGLSYVSPLKYAVNISEQTGKTTTVTNFKEVYDNQLRSNMSKGTISSPYDLSMYDIYGNARATAQPATANSYVVTSEGWYMFPLVYGNSIDYGTGLSHSTDIRATVAGGGNKQSYAPTSAANSGSYLTPFINYAGLFISTPSIMHDIAASSAAAAVKASATIDKLNAVVVWEDNDGTAPTIDAGSVEVLPWSTISSKTNSSLTDVPYIRFYVNSGANIRQGNAVIALRDGENRIMWSWHIWFTPIDLTTIPMNNKHGTIIDFMPVNLGYCDDRTITKDEYNDYGTCWVKVFQSGREASTSKYFKITHRGDFSETTSGKGASPYYHWGRKDPFLPNSSTAYTTNKEWHSPAGYQIVSTTAPTTTLNFYQFASTAGFNMHHAIQNPYIHMYNANNGSWYGGPAANKQANLWDADATTYSQDSPVVKTIYDPCPPGFSVLRFYSFSSFIGDSYESGVSKRYTDINVVGQTDDGFYLTDNTKSAIIFFPNVGFRGHDNGMLMNHYGTIQTIPQGAYWLGTTNNSISGHGAGLYAPNASASPTGEQSISPFSTGPKSREYTVRPMAN
ncbi:MAG: hypothetical protein IKI67_02780 [Bacteroidales bacterium]|nr:hypothetical protein [Bacteroidales bacterium]